MLNILDVPVKLIRTRDHPSMVIAPGQPRGFLSAGCGISRRSAHGHTDPSSYASSCFGSNVTRAPLGDAHLVFSDSAPSTSPTVAAGDATPYQLRPEYPVEAQPSGESNRPVASHHAGREQD